MWVSLMAVCSNGRKPKRPRICFVQVFSTQVEAIAALQSRCKYSHLSSVLENQRGTDEDNRYYATFEVSEVSEPYWVGVVQTNTEWRDTYIHSVNVFPTKTATIQFLSEKAIGEVTACRLFEQLDNLGEVVHNDKIYSVHRVQKSN